MKYSFQISYLNWDPESSMYVPCLVTGTSVVSDDLWIEGGKRWKIILYFILLFVLLFIWFLENLHCMDGMTWSKLSQVNCVTILLMSTTTPCHTFSDEARSQLHIYSWRRWQLMLLFWFWKFSIWGVAKSLIMELNDFIHSICLLCSKYCSNDYPYHRDVLAVWSSASHS